MGHLLLLSTKEKKHFVSFHVSVVLFVTIHGLFSCFKEMLFFSLCVSLRVLCSLGACHQKLHKSAKHRSVEPSKRAQQIPVNLPTPLHCVRNILCLHAPPALKKVRSLTAPWLFFFYSKFCCVLCYISAWLCTTRNCHTAKLQISSTFILSYLVFSIVCTLSQGWLCGL